MGRKLSILMRFYKKWNDDDAGSLSAALAFYSIFSAIPLLIITLSVASIVLNQDIVRQQFFEQAQVYLGKSASAAFEKMLDGWDVGSSFGLPLGILLLFFAATGIFNHLQQSLNRIFRATPKGGWRGILKKRAVAFAMLVLVGFTLVISMMINSIIMFFKDSLDFGIAQLLDFVLFLLITTLLFAMLYRILPDKKIPMRHIWPGAFLTGFLFGVGRYLISIYISNSIVASAFGAASFVIILLLWIYYTSLILFAGAEFVYIYSNKK